MNEYKHLKFARVLYEYLSKNKRDMPLDADARRIIDTSLESHSYFLYSVEGIEEQMKKAGIFKEDLNDDEPTILDREREGIFIEKLKIDRPYTIAIRAEFSDKFKICIFVHEFVHFQYKLGSWKDRKPDDIEGACDKPMYDYADSKGKEFLARFQAVRRSFNFKQRRKK